ncbi:MAG: T9SS type A sorting domain-containing protein [Bacteroidetes bacterium]|nr:T9SS type A sorting domain-containing protein [Bacteroidota bacterium]
MKYRIFLCLISLAICQFDSYAQSPLSRIWENSHNGTLTGLDHANAIVVTANGDVYVTGQSFQNSTTGSITTIKYDANGNMIWTDNYKGVIVTAMNEGVDLCIDPFGNVVATGDVAFNDGDFCIIKFNTNGRLWAKSKEPYWFGSSYDFARKIDTDAAGNIYTAAMITSLSGNMYDLYTLKCDSAGNDIWAVDYTSASGDDYAQGLAVTDNGHCFSLTSSFNFFGSATYDIQTLHYDSSGTQQWISNYNCQSSQSEDYPIDIKCDNNYNTWVCGAADTGTSTNMIAYKQNQYGTRLWSVNYNGNANGNDTAVAISSLPNNLTVVCGRTKELINGLARDVITTMLIDSGTVLWMMHYAGDSIGAVPTAMTTDAAGNIYISGYFSTIGAGKNAVLLVYDINGNLIYTDEYAGIYFGDDFFSDIYVDGLSYIYVTGSTSSAANNNDYITIKYAMPGISSLAEEKEQHALRIYPNPSHGSFQLLVDGKAVDKGDLFIYDVQGNLIQSGQIKAYSQSFEKLTSGMYLLRYVDDSYECTSKIVVY